LVEKNEPVIGSSTPEIEPIIKELEELDHVIDEKRHFTNPRRERERPERKSKGIIPAKRQTQTNLASLKTVAAVCSYAFLCICAT
jgi:hypothetical protein